MTTRFCLLRPQSATSATRIEHWNLYAVFGAHVRRFQSRLRSLYGHTHKISVRAKEGDEAT